ncbi:hypothetical protein HPB51_021978 [Rhipicephalus microplus]|uniref:Uncharacterized protein n=1 Tax=Rhipicephalus microplus TaxID=6941 RepID=A0A9J6DXS8_RHIMP|nr:hypothetical protein HPB51_021978 [Rhipicephalus microplus]
MGHPFLSLEELARFSQQIAEPSAPAVPIVVEEGELINRHAEEVWKHSSTLEKEQKKTEFLQSTFGSLKKDKDKIVELAKSIGSAISDVTLDPNTAIRRLVEENVALRQEAESAKAECEKLLSEEKARLEYIGGCVEELLGSQERYQEKVNLKDEELLRLKLEVDQYVDTLGSQRLD